MAEFKNIARKYIRMCDSFGSACNGCPIRKPGSDNIYACRNRVLRNPEKYEVEIITWAAEHPKPVYPTWFEWFKTVVPDEEMLQRGMYWDMQIPADIAQKLGIEPKKNL